MNRNGLDFTFSWIFAIIAGAVILFSAIYITNKLISSQELEQDTFVAGQLSNLLAPIETNLEDTKYSVIEFSEDTRVYNECSNEGVFGSQKLSTSSKGLGEDYSKQSVRKSTFNRYIFSRGVEETDGKKMRVITKPLTMPFKIGDLIIMYGQNYCFVNPTGAIEEELMDISSDGKQNIGINISSNANSCPKDFTKVCFNQIGCEINVNTQSKVVTKYGKELYYTGDSLEIAAILSDPLIYECQLKRLASRAGELGALYSSKSTYIEGNGCSNNLVGDLQNFVAATNVNSSRDFARRLAPIAQNLEEKNNELTSCKIF